MKTQHNIGRRGEKNIYERDIEVIEIAKGIGTTKFTVREDPKLQNICLQNVLLVPTIQKNLINMAKMDQAGNHAKLDKGFKNFSDGWK